jgi:hypothetical protein
MGKLAYFLSQDEECVKAVMKILWGEVMSRVHTAD